MRARRIALLPTLLLGLVAAAGSAMPAAASPQAPATYTNPVTQGYSIDFPDPAVLRGKDGMWYGFATGGPYDEQGEASDSSKIATSPDLVHWQRVGPIFGPDNWPSFAASGTGFWAPDVRYLDGRYLMYFTVPDTTASTQTFDPAIGVATADTPAGPWRPEPEPLIAPKPVGGGYDTVIDPAQFTDTDGTRYLYYGSYGSGVWVVKLSADGMHVTSEPTHIAPARYEGSYVIHRDGWYYLMASSGNCCAGPTTGYTVFAGRARSPLGPFVDRLGVPLMQSRSGGTPVIAPNGNRWIGTGHNSLVVDAAGQQWMTYHAIEKNDPWLDVSPGFTMRPMNLDRLDWIDGWPLVRAGRFASDGPQPAPVTKAQMDDRFEDAAATAAGFDVRGGTLDVTGPDPQSGRYASLAPGTVATTRRSLASDVRVEADVRSSGATRVGVVARADGHGSRVRAVVDTAAHRLRLEDVRHGVVLASRWAPLPEDYVDGAWHTLALEVRGGTASADVTDDRLGDPYATVSMPVRDRRPGAAGVVSSGPGEVDNFAANRLFTPVTRAVPPPSTGRLDPAYSDEFDGSLGAGWSWVRQDDAAKVTGGALTWPTQSTDIVGDGTPGVLLRDAPDGTYTVQTKLSIDIGTDTVRNFQQGGIIVYDGDDDFLRLDVVAVGVTRIVEFGKETVFSGRKSWGGGDIGAPGATTWLRIHHTVNPANGEHLFRAASSTDGRRWTWGLTWTMPADAHPRLGLTSEASLPGTTEQFGPATSRFDYFRVYR